MVRGDRVGYPETLLSITSTASVLSDGLLMAASVKSMVDVRSLPSMMMQKAASSKDKRRLQEVTSMLDGCLSHPSAVETMSEIGVQTVYTGTERCSLSHEALKQFLEEEAAPQLDLDVMVERNSEISIAGVGERAEVRGIRHSKTAAAFNDNYAQYQWGMDIINMPEAWGVWEKAMIGRPEREIVVGVLDTGVEIGHEDLRHEVFSDEVCNHGLSPDELIDDVNGHGTHCAGILGAQSNNSKGIAGVSRAKIMSIRVLDERGWGVLSDMLTGINYAITKNVDILSNSYTSPMRSEIVKSAIGRAGERGMLFVCAAGNEGVDISVNKVYPCAYTQELDNVMCVGSTDKDIPYMLAVHSNYAPYLDIAAPGVEIISTYPDNTYRYLTGTSMATPHVTGVAALLMSLGVSAKDAKTAMKTTAVDINNAIFVPVVKYGRLNALEAVKAAVTMPTVPVKPARSVGGDHCTPQLPTAPPTRQPGPSSAATTTTTASIFSVSAAAVSLIIMMMLNLSFHIGGSIL
ncbi:Suppressor of the cold-sensitive snRNP bioproteinsis mutant brr1-1 [Perkinsus chesapeaki]|uniref:subtilisin n=1 Tax=Perkinsus chesapeaki TaxID=330153 RepID=A0A7J6L349_PERCH|nr:Suppressor of the cold-sensitive snRNP bioproteinsis mutant brr1-1 [Perkinsus chesapeaki]